MIGELASLRAAGLVTSLAPMTIVTSVRANSSLMSSISFMASYSTSASASSTFMWPGMRPATGWIAYFTSTPRSSSSDARSLTACWACATARPTRDDDHLVGVGHLDGGVGGRGGPHMLVTLVAATDRDPAATEAAGDDRGDGAVHRLGHQVGQDRAGRADDHAGDDHRGVVQRQTRCGRRNPGQRVEQRDDHRHVGAADRQHHQPEYTGRGQQADHPPQRRPAAGMSGQPDHDGCHHRAGQQQQVQRLLRLAEADRAAGRISCSLPNAMSEPQNEIEPMIAANSDATTMCAVGLAVLERRKPSVSMNSAARSARRCRRRHR